VPAATPIPRRPTVLTLYTAADLLAGLGCPVCRYADEAGDRYLAWFAFEAHADAVTITRLCSSLGMCPRHTRGVMSQPGAAVRLTAVYRYVLEEARDRLSGRAARLGICPACEHDDGAVGRALDTLLEGLTENSVRERYRELGGLCIPHLGAATARGHRVAAWLSQTMTAAVGARSASPGWLAGTDRDAEMRAVLRHAMRAGAGSGSGVCIACLTAARSEHDHLARILRASECGQRDHRLLLCAGHLNDLIVLAGHRDAASLLAWQAGCLTAGLTRRPASSPSRKLGDPASWLRSRRRRAGSPDGCPICLAAEDAAQRAVDDLRASLRASHPVTGRLAPLCVRHLLGLRALDPWAGHVTARGAVERAETLIAELNEAFSKNTWAHRHETRGPEMTAWRRAPVFLDGSVFCGCPPRET
jgi:hypothetical protein